MQDSFYSSHSKKRVIKYGPGTYKYMPLGQGLSTNNVLEMLHTVHLSKVCKHASRDHK